MEQELINLLLNGGANIAFGMFLYMQNKELQKRADSREAKQEKKEEDLRARYDKVISDMQIREDAIRKELVSEINDMDKRLTMLETKIEHIFNIVDEIKAKFVRVG
jgi:predicted  nucleic acid-binding Zn-ribbon protein